MRKITLNNRDPFGIGAEMAADERRRAKKAAASRRLWIVGWALICVIDLLLLPLTIIPALFSQKVREWIAMPVVAFLMMIQ